MNGSNDLYDVRGARSQLLLLMVLHKLLLHFLLPVFLTLVSAEKMRLSTNAALVEHLVRAGVIGHEAVRAAMLQIDRKNYAGGSSPYDDNPQYIGHGATISAPHMHAHSVEKLLPYIENKEDCKILDCGSGSGYLCALLARINPKATVFGIDIVPELVEASIVNMRKQDGDLLDSGRVRLSVGSGWEGYEKENGNGNGNGNGVFDAIHVGAAAVSIPRTLLQQLKLGGSILIPVGPESRPQKMVQAVRMGASGDDSTDFHIVESLDVMFVPLVKQKK